MSSPPAEDTPVLFKKKRRAPVASGSRVPPARRASDEAAVEAQAEDGAPGADEEDLSVADLLALRSLTRRPGGLSLEKLNAGAKEARRKKDKKAAAGDTEEEKWRLQMERGGLVSKAAAAESDDEDTTAARKLVRANNFQGETGTVDVDAHMMAYIEAELASRRAAAAPSGTSSSAGTTSAEAVARAIGGRDAEDELFRIAERYRVLQDEAKGKKDKESEQGLSSALLTSVMEVDLGMDSRLKNISETEQAKRALAEAHSRRGAVPRNEEDEMLASTRFFRPHQSAQSDAEALKAARAADEHADRTGGVADFPEGHLNAQVDTVELHQAAGHPKPALRHEPPAAKAQAPRGGGKRETASDEAVMERFKKRQRNQLK